VACLTGCTTPAYGQAPVDTPQESTNATHQDANPWRKARFGATLEAYYQYNWNRTPDRADGFLVRSEYRRDWSNELFFPGRLGAADLRRHQNTVLIGGVSWFGNKSGAW
jgi:hypothetical protein